MSWEVIAAVTPVTALLGLAIWRFARLETCVKHQAECQTMLVKAVSRLNVRQKLVATKLDKHLSGGR